MLRADTLYTILYINLCYLRRSLISVPLLRLRFSPAILVAGTCDQKSQISNMPEIGDKISVYKICVARFIREMKAGRRVLKQVLN